MKTIYGSKSCHKCKVLVRELKDKGEQFDYIDIDTLTYEQLQELSVKADGKTSLPIVLEV